MIYLRIITSILFITTGVLTIFSETNSLFAIPFFGGALTFLVSGILDLKQTKSEAQKES